MGTSTAIRHAAPAQRRFQRPTSAGHRLVTVIGGLDRLPALEHSHTRLLELLAAERRSLKEIVVTIETDVGLATAVLRAARDASARDPAGSPPGASVPECVRLLGDGLDDAVRRVPVFDFFDRSSVIACEAGRQRVHALATQDAARRLTRELRAGPAGVAPLAALFHDVGRIALALAWDGYGDLATAPLTPEARLARERDTFGIDHATAGSVLMRHLGLPAPLASAVEHHHSDHVQGDAALIRVADMLAHYCAGDPIDAHELAGAARSVGLDNGALRKLLYEAPASSQPVRRDLEPCPLSGRQREILQLLGQGKTYKQIAKELDRSDSTVRSHIYGSYRKLGVNDRAQAVLLGRDRGWI
jgi:putative nucleotidyltransferase with HDIG domain